MIKLDKSVWIYIVALFTLTYIVQTIAILSGGEESTLFPVLIGLAMFLPGIGAVIYLLKTKEGLGFIDWRIGKPLYVVISLILPPIITLLGILFFEKIGWGINYAYTFKDQLVQDIDIPLFLGSNPQNLSFFLFNFLLTGIGFSLITSLLTVGEEIGWRGFLQKKLLQKNSPLISLIFLGIIWGFWHFPLIINGFNYPEYPYLGAFLIFPINTVFISFFFGWLSINSRSIWPAVFAHGAVNSVMIFLFEMDFGERKLEANFMLVGIWALIGTVSYMLMKKPPLTTE